jgi:DNA (cytosine-5)-methyltransferase 1
MNNSLTFVDLFSGAGGASVGLINAGFIPVGAIEIDDWAADTYELNHPKVKVLRENILNVSDETFKSFKGVDLVVGGPPCQGFSIAASNRRDSKDPRNNLYIEYIRAIKYIKPKVFIVENVKELVKFKLASGQPLLNDFIEKLEKLNYTISYTFLNAKDLGVPQDRIRFFMVGFLNSSESILFNKNQTPIVTLYEAISDLPTPSNNLELNYELAPQNNYQENLRQASKTIRNHEAMKHTQRLIERFKLIPINGNTSNVPAFHRNRTRGNVETLSDKIYHQNHRRLNPDVPCKTITASFYSSFLHPYQHRNLTVREAARIQGFPDKFIFLGKRTTLSKKLLEKKGIFEDMHLDQFNQVGNAVSPIVAEYLGLQIINKLNGKKA